MLNILATIIFQPFSLSFLIISLQLCASFLSSFPLFSFLLTLLDHGAPTQTPSVGCSWLSDFVCPRAEGSKRRSRPDWRTQGATDRWQAARPQSNPPRGAKVLARLPQPHLWLDAGAARWVQAQFALPSTWHGSTRTVTLPRVSLDSSQAGSRIPIWSAATKCSCFLSQLAVPTALGFSFFSVGKTNKPYCWANRAVFFYYYFSSWYFSCGAFKQQNLKKKRKRKRKKKPKIVHFGPKRHVTITKADDFKQYWCKRSSKKGWLVWDKRQFLASALRVSCTVNDTRKCSSPLFN